jgi:tetratricopeptide (TPR) repeat protein
MWDLAVREEDYQGIDEMLARYVGQSPLSMRLLPAAARSDTATVRALLDEGRALESRQLQIAARYAASYLQDFDLADSLARLDLQWRERPVNRAAVQLLLAGLAAAGGRWSESRDAFLTAGTMEGAGAVVIHRAFAATLPLQPVHPEELRTIRDEVTRWDASTAPGASLAGALQPHLRHYLLGMLSSRMGDYQAAGRAAMDLEQLATPPRAEVVARGLAATVRADVAWMQNRHADVVRTLEGVDLGIPLELISLPRPAHLREFGLEHARYLRAVSLSALGRDSEALQWLRFGLRGSPQEYLYHAPVHVRMGEVFERLGQPDSARAHYGKFLELWSRADSGALPHVDEARRRLARLTALGQK